MALRFSGRVVPDSSVGSVTERQGKTEDVEAAADAT